MSLFAIGKTQLDQAAERARAKDLAKALMLTSPADSAADRALKRWFPRYSPSVRAKAIALMLDEGRPAPRAGLANLPEHNNGPPAAA